MAKGDTGTVRGQIGPTFMWPYKTGSKCQIEVKFGYNQVHNVVVILDLSKNTMYLFLTHRTLARWWWWWWWWWWWHHHHHQHHRPAGGGPTSSSASYNPASNSIRNLKLQKYAPTEQFEVSFFGITYRAAHICTFCQTCLLKCMALMLINTLVG